MKLTKKITLVFFLAFAYVAALLLLVYVESIDPNVQIKNFGDAFWYSFVTLTTLGYGDVLPVTWLGKFIGGVFVLLSIFLLSIIVGRVSENLNNYRGKKKMGFYGTEFKNHIVIIGWDHFAYLIAKELLAANRKIAVILDNKDLIDVLYEDLGRENLFILYSQFDNVNFFSKANLKDAHLIFVNLKTDTEKLVLTLNLKKDYPTAKYLITLDESNLKDTFRSAGVTYCFSKNEIASKLIASYIFEPDVADYSADLLENTKSDNDYDIQEYLITEDNALAGKTYGDVFSHLKSKYNIVVIGLVKIDNEERSIIKLPADNTIVSAGDYIILITSGLTVNQIETLFGVKQGV